MWHSRAVGEASDASSPANYASARSFPGKGSLVVLIPATSRPLGIELRNGETTATSINSV